MYPLVFQCFSELSCVISSVAEQPIDSRQATQQGSRADVVVDLSGDHEKVERSAPAVSDSVQFSVHAALRPTNQASTPPFITPKLVAVR